ncbi:MAG TPA: hypothetical protein VMZ31_17285 [Phycisphaerae bacterium]|nr:hypothetical protein [Phycisphaerae bacterium]
MGLTSLLGCHGAHLSGAPDESPGVYPPSPYPTRIVALGPLSTRYRLNPELGSFMRFVTGQEEPPPGRLPRPLAVTVADQSVIACDAVWHAVVTIDLDAGTVRPLIRADQPTPERPVAVAIDANRRAYVADAAGGSVFVVEPEGVVGEQLRLPSGLRRFRPVGLTCGEDELFVVNAGEHCIEVFALDTGKWIKTIGVRGAHEGQFHFPVAAATGPDGRLYVVDMLNGRVQVLDSKGGYVGQIGRPGNRPGQLARPRGVAVGPDGIVYVTDAATQVVQMFDSQGRVLMHFGGAGSGRGSMGVPAGICVDRSLLERFSDGLPEGFKADYLVLVANQFGDQGIEVYAFGLFEKDRSRVASTETLR